MTFVMNVDAKKTFLIEFLKENPHLWLFGKNDDWYKMVDHTALANLLLARLSRDDKLKEIVLGGVSSLLMSLVRVKALQPDQVWVPWNKGASSLISCAPTQDELGDPSFVTQFGKYVMTKTLLQLEQKQVVNIVEKILSLSDFFLVRFNLPFIIDILIGEINMQEDVHFSNHSYIDSAQVEELEKLVRLAKRNSGQGNPD